MSGCVGKTKLDKPCQSPPQLGKDVCRNHDPSEAAALLAERQKGGRISVEQRGETAEAIEGLITQADTVTGVSLALDKVVAMVATKRISPHVANALKGLLDSKLRCLESALESRVEALEHLAKDVGRGEPFRDD